MLVVGELSLVGDPEHARAVEPDEAVGWLRDRSESASALLAHRRLTSLFALRARSKPLDAHEPVVVVIDTAHTGAEQLAEITDMAHGDLGAVVVLVGPEPASEWRLVVEPDVTRLEPLGLQLDPVAVAEAFVSTADEFIPPADPELDESVDDAWDDDAEADGQLVLADHLDIVHLHNRALPLDEEPTSGREPPEDGADDWDVELKVLGQVRAIGTKEPLSPTELHLAIYLAFNRNGQNADTIATMLWPNGINPRTLTNAMASLRRKLGTGADGEPLFPLGRDNQYTYSLSDRVVTDWDRFVALVDRAGRCDDEDDEADLLDQALELIDGPPFRASDRLLVGVQRRDRDSYLRHGPSRSFAGHRSPRIVWRSAERGECQSPCTDAARRGRLTRRPRPVEDVARVQSGEHEAALRAAAYQALGAVSGNVRLVRQRITSRTSLAPNADSEAADL